MSTYYYLYCPKCEDISSMFHAQQAWGTWTKGDDVDAWLYKHRDHKPYVVDEHSKESETKWLDSSLSEKDAN